MHSRSYNLLNKNLEYLDTNISYWYYMYVNCTDKEWKIVEWLLKLRPIVWRSLLTSNEFFNITHCFNFLDAHSFWMLTWSFSLRFFTSENAKRWYEMKVILRCNRETDGYLLRLGQILNKYFLLFFA